MSNYVELENRGIDEYGNTKFRIVNQVIDKDTLSCVLSLKTTTIFTSSLGVELHIVNHPEFGVVEGRPVLFLRGSSTRDKLKVITVPDRYVSMLLASVSEFNGKISITDF